MKRDGRQRRKKKRTRTNKKTNPRFSDGGLNESGVIMSIRKTIFEIFHETDRIYKEQSDEMEKIFADYPEKKTALKTGLNLSGCKLRFIEQSNQAYEKIMDKFDGLSEVHTMDELNRILDDIEKQFKNFQNEYYLKLDMKMKSMLF